MVDVSHVYHNLSVEFWHFAWASIDPILAGMQPLFPFTILILSHHVHIFVFEWQQCAKLWYRGN